MSLSVMLWVYVSMPLMLFVCGASCLLCLCQWCCTCYCVPKCANPYPSAVRDPLCQLHSVSVCVRCSVCLWHSVTLCQWYSVISDALCLHVSDIMLRLWVCQWHCSVSASLSNTACIFPHKVTKVHQFCCIFMCQVTCHIDRKLYSIFKPTR